MKSAVEPSLNFVSLSNTVFFCTLAALIGFVLWLPSFPNGDGPLHAYYAQVFGALIKGGTSYSHYYAIRHLVQPYCVHYYVLVLLEHQLGSEKAEEVFISIILATTAFGFRFMARRLGENSVILSLFMIPLLLDWTLSAGFLNYCLGVAIFFWSIGLWHRIRPQMLSLPLAGFAGLLIMLVFVHPIPLLVLIFFCMCDAVLVLLQKKSQAETSDVKALPAKLLALGLACIALLVPLAIADRGKVASVWRDCFPHRSVLLHLIEAKSLSYFWSLSPVVILYNFVLLCMLPVSILLLRQDIVRRWRSRTMTAADRQLIIMVLLVLSTITMPRTVGGGANFSERMWDLAWPMVIASTAGARLVSRHLRLMFMAAISLICLAAIVTVPRLHALSRKQAELSHIALPRGRMGLLLEPMSTTERSMGSSYPLFWWSGVRAFTRSDAVLLNSPWLDQVQIPIKLREDVDMPGAYMPPEPVEQPAYLTRDISNREPLALRALSKADFILYSAPNERPKALSSEVRRLLRHERENWSCTAGDIYVVCIRR